MYQNRFDLHEKLLGLDNFFIYENTLIGFSTTRCEKCLKECIVDTSKRVKYLDVDMKQIGLAINKNYVTQNEVSVIPDITIYDGSIEDYAFICQDCYDELFEEEMNEL